VHRQTLRSGDQFSCGADGPEVAVKKQQPERHHLPASGAALEQAGVLPERRLVDALAALDGEDRAQPDMQEFAARTDRLVAKMASVTKVRRGSRRRLKTGKMKLHVAICSPITLWSGSRLGSTTSSQ